MKSDSAVAELEAIMQGLRDKLHPLQQIEAPQPIIRGIPTLAEGVFRNPSPLVAVRFAFAGRWEEAFPGLILFGLSDMERSYKNHLRAELERSRRPELMKHYQHSPAGRFPPEELSEFGFNDIWSGNLYLTWAKQSDGEPALVWHERGHWQEFANLTRFFQYLAGA